MRSNRLFSGRFHGIISHTGAAFFLICILLIGRTADARENPSVLTAQGITLAQQGNIDAAIPLFEKAVILSPRSALAHYGLGKSYIYKEESAKKAVSELKLAIECDHKLTKAYFYLGFAYWFLGKHEYAITAFYQAYTLDRSYREALYNISAIYDVMGHESKSIRFYRSYRRSINSISDPF